MSAPDLLVVIDPVARATDGESVRIARDVLCAGARDAKVCVPDCAADMERALAKRGDRRPVVVGDDRALLRTVRLLHRERELAACALAVVPVGPAGGTALARALGVPGGAVDASRTALTGTERAMDLLVDDSGGVVLGALRVPARGDPRGEPRGGSGGEPGGGPRGPGREGGGPGAAGRGRAGGAAEGTGGGFGADAVAGPGGGTADRRGRVPEQRGAPEDAGPGADPSADAHPDAGGPGAERVPSLRGCRSLVRSLARPLPLLGALTGAAGAGSGHGAAYRLRVEADGTMLADLDSPVTGVSVAPAGGGLAVVTVRSRASSDPLYARARTVTVSGPDFRYRADAVVGGPVRARTWTALDSAWRLTLPAGPVPVDGPGWGDG